MIRENPDKYDIDLDDKNIRRFATFKLCIADCAQTESGSMKREKG